MSLENETLHYESLPTEPPEKRPTATKTFQDFKVLVFTATLVKIALYIRHRNMRVDTNKSKRILTTRTKSH